jgi:5-methylcytosine-specific restriction endonuclease McrA
LNRKYKSLTVPDEVWDEVAVAIYVATATNRLELKPFASKKAERVEAIRRIMSEYVAQAIPDLVEMKSRMFGTEYGVNAMAALERDEYRCVLCSHTRINAGSVEVHHIMPRGYHGPGRPDYIHDPDNLATLCSRCHNEITNPDAGNHWSAFVTRLKNAIGAPVPSGFVEGEKDQA